MVKTHKVAPRETPNRDSRYMALAWFYASFSKDPYTQVGAVIVNKYNCIMGCGYNGPPRLMNDEGFDWARPSHLEAKEIVDKYDVIVHAEINAIDHCCGELTGGTLYVTGLPCPLCMLAIARKELEDVIYMNYKSDAGSSLQSPTWRDKSLKIAEMGEVRVKEFVGNVSWMADWILQLKEKGVL